MNLTELINETSTKKIKVINAGQLEVLKNSAEIITERDTLISGSIRIMRIDDIYLLQETTNKSEITLRIFPSLESATDLLNERMEIYEKMWDGCGCKVNYYS